MHQVITKSSLSKVKIQGEVIAPQKKIKTLQNSQSEALLFSIGTDNQLYCVKEDRDNNENQWSKINLSKSLKGGKVIDFALAYVGTNLDLIVAVEEQGEHKVYTSIGNHLDGDFKQTTWEYIKYDDILKETTDDILKETTEKLRFSKLIVKQLDIQNIKNIQYISVFTDDDNQIFKYFIDLKAEPAKNKWQPRQLGLNYNKNLVDSCMGMPKKAKVAGLYTLGVAGGKDAILFTPLYDDFDHSLNPPATTLYVEKDGMSALATAKLSDGKTDLFVAGQGELYYFPYDKQKRDSHGIPVFTHDLFKDVEKLYAIQEDDKYIIWGQTKQKEIFYTVCSKDKVKNQKSWSNPIVLNSGIVQFSSFFNRQTKEITYFALKDSNELIYAVRSPETTVWKETNIVTPTTDNSQFESTAHVTSILVTDDNGQTQNDTTVTLQATAPCRVYVNNLFMLLDNHPKTITTNSDGMISIVEPTNNLEGTCLKVKTAQSKEVFINPMNNSMEKLSGLKTTNDLSKIGIDNNTPNNTKTELLKTIQKMSELYFKMPIDNTPSSFSSATTALTLPSNQVFSTELLVESGAIVSRGLNEIGDFFNDGIKKVVSFAGDVISTVKNVAGKIAKIAVGFAEGAWRIVTKLGGEIYHFVVDTIQNIVSSVSSFISSILNKAKEWIDSFLNISKGVDAYVFSEPSFSPTIEIAGQIFGDSSDGYHSYEKEISVRDILKNSITLKTQGVTKTAKVNPFTGLLSSKDLGHMLHTSSVITDDYAISYGLYDAGMGLKGLTNKNQVYLYVSKNHSNWLGDLIIKHPNKDILISDLVLAGAHDSGMYIDIPTETAIMARSLLVAAGFVIGTVPIVGILTPAIFTAAAVYDPKKISRNLAVTQKESITNQLKLGVRFFDFRPGYNIMDLATTNGLLEIVTNLVKSVTADTKESELQSIGKKVEQALLGYIYTGLPICHIHAIIPGIELKQMISETIAFLEQHPKEIVVIEMKYSGILLDKMKPTYEVIDQIIEDSVGSQVKRVNVVKPEKGIISDYNSWATFNTAKVKDLIKENKRLVIAYEQETNDSYNDYAYSLANPDYVINGCMDSTDKKEGLVDTISHSTEQSLSVMQLQGTITNTLFNIKDPEVGNLAENVSQLALTLAAQTNAGSYLLSTKGKMDSKTYPWLKDQLVTNKKGKGTMILLNDFVDSMQGSIAVEATDERIQNK